MVRILSPRKALRLCILVAIGFSVILTLRSWDKTDGGSRTDQSFFGAAVKAGRDALGHKTRTRVGEKPHVAPAIHLPSYCDHLKLKKIAIITKTGASEPKDKLLAQLSTCLSCVPDPLIFSDLDQTVGHYQIHDVLSRISRGASANNPEFDIYYKQKELAAKGRESELTELGKIPTSISDWRTEGKSAAWALDKYKFLHMVERAWEYQPERDWYVFIETDTYISLSNLVKFLDTQDPNQQLYAGKSVPMWEHPRRLSFAHGGSGFILSGALVHNFTVTHKGLTSRYDWHVRYSWFGDFILADIIDRSLDVRVTDISPLFQGDSPTNFPFAGDYWCKPAITLHYMTPREFAHVFEFEKSRNFSEMLFQDLYNITYGEMADLELPLERDEWDNGSDDDRYRLNIDSNSLEQPRDGWDEEVRGNPDESFDACELACILKNECLQFSFHTYADGKAKCYLSQAVRLGEAAKAGYLNAGNSVHSGWLSEKITEQAEQRQSCVR